MLLVTVIVLGATAERALLALVLIPLDVDDDY
jgi:hypothetical protein